MADDFTNALIARYSDDPSTSDVLGQMPPPSLRQTLAQYLQTRAQPAIDMWRNAEDTVAQGNADVTTKLARDLNVPEESLLPLTMIGGVKAPGQPPIWYRGTPHMDRLLNWTEVTPEGLKGTYFTSDPEYAKSYGPVRGYNVNGSIKRVELPDLGKVGADEWDRIHDAEVSRAHAEGHAGVHLFEPDPASPGSMEEREMILFDPRNAVEILRKYGLLAPVAGATLADVLSQSQPEQKQ